MILCYNTNGLAHHEPIAALEMLAEVGYQGISITIDHSWFSPSSPPAQRERIGKRIRDLGLKTVIETGARFLVDPRRKHWPSLVASTEVARPRVDLIRYACQLAAELQSQCVSIWSGVCPDHWDRQLAWDALAGNVELIMREADAQQVVIGFEPEPGMLVDRISEYFRLVNWVSHPRLGLTMDIGHLFCQGEVPVVGYIHKCAEQIVNVHIEDSHPGTHEHLMFGDGLIHFPPIIEAFAEVGYEGPLSVELGRHSHDAVNAVQKSFDFLQPLIHQKHA